MAGTMAIAVSAGVLASGARSATAASVAAPKPTSPAAAQAPYVAVKHKVVLNATVKAKAIASFTVSGAAGVPGNASAVVLSVVVPAPTAGGTIAVFPYGAKRPGVVNLSFVAKHAATATVVVTPGSKGKASLYRASSKAGRVQVTVVGYYAAPGSASAANAKTRFLPLPPKRLASVVAKAGGSASFATTGVPATGVAGVVLSVTVSGPSHAGALAVYPSGAKAGASSFTFQGGRSATSLLIVKPGAKGRITVVNRSKAAVRVWADIVGYLHTLAVPGAPREVTAVAQNGGALISWKAPASDGGAPLSAYRVEVVPGGATVLTSPAALQTSVGGLRNGTPYSFVLVAMNSAGSSAASAPSLPIVPYGVPASPTNVVAKASDIGKVTVTVTAPSDTGGLPVSGYKVTASPGGRVATSSTTSIDVTGLTSGQVYTFTAATVTAASSSLPSAPSNAAIAEGTSRVSVAADGGEPNNISETDASFSADGRYVAFTSNASNLTSGDNNMYSDVYVRDRLLDTTTLVSVPAAAGASGDNDSSNASISADGRYVAFESQDTNLVSPPTTTRDIYVRDLVAKTTRLVSVNPTGNEADGGSSFPQISADGSSVVFSSSAHDLVAGDTNSHDDIFVATLALHSVSLSLASVSTAGTQGDGNSIYATISATGRYVAFESMATNLTTLTTGAHEQVYLRDDVSGVTTMISEATALAGGDDDSLRPSISADGRRIAFQSFADNIVGGDTNTVVDVFLADLSSGHITRESGGSGAAQSDGASAEPIISADGRYVAFDSDADNLVPGDTNAFQDVFRIDTNTGVTVRLSTSNGGAQGNDYSIISAMSPDGQHVSFYSPATNLLDATPSNRVDEYVRDLG
jgi:Tol biopolymer transport system component